MAEDACVVEDSADMCPRCGVVEKQPDNPMGMCDPCEKEYYEEMQAEMTRRAT